MAKDNFAKVSPDLRSNILAYYSDLNRPIETKKDADEWKELLANLEALQKQAQAAP
jgi:hypothetical protein